MRLLNGLHILWLTYDYDYDYDICIYVAVVVIGPENMIKLSKVLS